MGKVRVRFTCQFADDMADLFYFIESKGLRKTAQKYADDVYNFIEKIDFDKINFAFCKEKIRNDLGLK